MATRLAALDGTDDAFPKKASWIFLNEVLREEFGEELWVSADFQSIVEDMQLEWQGDADLVEALRDLAGQDRS